MSSPTRYRSPNQYCSPPRCGYTRLCAPVNSVYAPMRNALQNELKRVLSEEEKELPYMEEEYDEMSAEEYEQRWPFLFQRHC